MKERPLVAVGVDEVRMVAELCPLSLVVLVSEPRRIGSFSGRLQFDVASQQAVNSYTDVRARTEVGG